MKNLWQVLLGIIVAVASIGLLLGSFSLSLAEANTAGSPTRTPTLTLAPTLTPSSSPTLALFTPLADSPTSSPTPTSTLTATLPPTPTNCPPPAGWLPYIVQSGDTLEKLALHYRISSAQLQQANCLLASGLLPGVIIYVPPAPTQTTLPCGQPYNWIVYFVQPGDTLYRLSVAYGITVGELQRANCMSASTLLHTGQILYVPPWAPQFPTPTATAIPFSTETSTPSSGLPSDTPTLLSPNTPTDSPVPAPSDTPVEVPTETPATP
jgi:LysM repeat protein